MYSLANIRLKTAAPTVLVFFGTRDKESL